MNLGLSSSQRNKTLLFILYAGLACIACTTKAAVVKRRPARKRKRKNVNAMMDELGPSYIKRGYRMDRETFWKLHRLIWPKMKYKINAPDNKGVPGVPQTNGARNGLINSSLRLSAALRYFAAGSPIDIALSHGISVKDVYTSVWRVVDAINDTEQLKIRFPEKDEQKILAAKAKQKSAAEFDGAVGFIDGMLIWTDRPTKKECDKAGIGPKKFFCGRKKKFCMNMTATVDIH